MLEQLQNTLIHLRQQKPLVLCLTNYVSMEFTANSLLALGAAPLMCESDEEIKELIALCDSVYINIGTLNTSFINRCEQALALAKNYHKAIILDPVGAGASKLRTATATAFCQYASIIKGNATEIMALVNHSLNSAGVETAHSTNQAQQSAQQLARTFKSTVAVSGASDFISDGQQEKILNVGSPLMTRVTGMGCALAAVIAAFKATMTDTFLATELAIRYFGLCGSLAAQVSDKPGSFRTLFLDELYAANFEKMEKYYAPQMFIDRRF